MERIFVPCIANYLAILALEKLGSSLPTQDQIDAAEMMMVALIKIVNGDRELKSKCIAREDLIGTLIDMYFDSIGRQ